MREIKFRAWHTVEKIFWYFNLVTVRTSKAIDRDWFRLEPAQQFIGLLDKNKKEIYEGDVVKEMIEAPFQRAHGTFSHKEVVYRSGMWVLSYLSSEKGFVLPRGYMASDLLSARESDSKEIFFYDDLEPVEELEVIGNIYENPELLKP